MGIAGDVRHGRREPWGIGRPGGGPACACRLAVLLAFVVGLGDVVMAQQGLSLLEGPGAPEQPPVRAELLVEHESVQPGGTTRIGVRFSIEAGWHIYAQDPGDAGLPTRIHWDVPAGMKVGPLAWPDAEAFLDPGNIRTYGFQHSAVVHAALLINRAQERGTTIPLRAEVSWLACQEICIPGSASLERVLPVRPEPPRRSADASWFADGHVSD